MRVHGLSTLEIMATCAVIGALVTISLPSFSDHTHKARRADALAALAAVQQAQELYRSQHAVYASSLATLGRTDTSSAGHYRLSTETTPDTAASAYRILAVGQNVQATDRACRYLGLELSTGQSLERSGPTADLANDAATNQTCWRR